jgi:hypothetical protein
MKTVVVENFENRSVKKFKTTVIDKALPLGKKPL